MSLERLQTLADAAVTALESGDYATAIQKALACKPLLAVTPELARASAGNSQSIAFRTTSEIDGFISECRKLQTGAAVQASGPFQQSLVRYQRAS